MKIATLLTMSALLISLSFFQVSAQNLLQESDNSSQLKQLEPYRSSPQTEVTAIIQFNRLLKEEELGKIKFGAKVSAVWIGARVNGEIKGTNQPAYENDTLESVFQRYRSLSKSMEEILESSKPSPDIVIPKKDLDAYGVYGVSLEGTAAEITEELQRVPKSRLLNVAPSKTNAPKLLNHKAALGSAPLAAGIPAINRRILPNRGRFIAAQSDQPRHRYVLNWFSWDNYYLLDGFKDNEAYEHQVVLNKYDGSTYLGRSTAWDSNMPGAYLDTTILNLASEPDWTVGTYYPKELVPGTWYYTLIVAEEGNASSDTGKISGQVKGYYCLDPLCVIGKGDTQFIRRAWTVSLPGSFDWVRPQINDVTPLSIPTGSNTTITLKGKDFAAPFGARVKIGNQVYPIHWGAQTKFISPNEVQVIVQIGDVNSADIEFSLWLETWDGQISNEVRGLRAVKTSIAPTITRYAWSTTPKANQAFGGTITGTNFIASGTQVWFCVSGTNTCYQHPMTGVIVTNSTTLTVSNVKLASGSWQIYLKTAAGQSRRSTAFTVLSVPPTISRYTWSTTPIANVPFSGTVSGTGFVPGGTQVWFCVSNTNTCYQHPVAGVTINSPTSLSLINVRLGVGSWQFYLKTSAGQSTRSTAFTVQTTTQPTITKYIWNTPPVAGLSFGGTITGTNFVTGGTQVWFCINGTSTCYQHPAGGVIVTNSTTLTVNNVRLGSGSWQIYLQTLAGKSVRSTPFNVQAPLPTVTGYSWNSTPLANQSFGGQVSGTRFVSGATQVWFCMIGSSTCYQHPATGVAVINSTSLTVSNVRLSSGAWQIVVKTAAGQSARSTPFTVQPVGPTITGYNWSTLPKANQAFGGTITGTSFVAGGTQVWFCLSGTSTCYQHPAAGVTVNSSTSLAVTNVNLGAGSWQFYLKTSTGQSLRSTAFTVQAALPTITGYSWTSTPFANQPFGGTISGTGFVSGATQVWFCVNSSVTCYQHPSAGITVNSSTSLTVSNVNLGGGSWQMYIKTAAGQSARSTAFTVQTQAQSPTITGYSWNTTPVENQSFGGTINGTDFVPGGTQVWFCLASTNACYQHPSAGVTVNNSTSLSVNSVNLSSGWWYIYVQTSAGLSAPSTSFNVQAAWPTITGYSWNTTPVANQPFGGTITGTGFVSGGTQVWFCVTSTSTCYQHPGAGVSVNSPTGLNVINVNLGNGSWQIYVQTSAGQSSRSAAFTVW